MSDTPTIRFKGFSDDWEQRKVTDLGEIYIGLVTTMTEHYTDCGLCMKVTLKTILPLSGQGLHPSKKIISSRKLLPLL